MFYFRRLISSCESRFHNGVPMLNQRGAILFAQSRVSEGFAFCLAGLSWSTAPSLRNACSRDLYMNFQVYIDRFPWISFPQNILMLNTMDTIPWICYERSFIEFYLSIWNQLIFNQRLQLFVKSPQPYILIFAWRNLMCFPNILVQNQMNIWIPQKKNHKELKS